MTLQYYAEDGNRHEAVGTLEKAEIREGEPVLHIRKKDDTLVLVPAGRIRAGRVVEPR